MWVCGSNMGVMLDACFSFFLRPYPDYTVIAIDILFVGRDGGCCSGDGGGGGGGVRIFDVVHDVGSSSSSSGFLTNIVLTRLGLACGIRDHVTN